MPKKASPNKDYKGRGWSKKFGWNGGNYEILRRRPSVGIDNTGIIHRNSLSNNLPTVHLFLSIFLPFQKEK